MVFVVVPATQVNRLAFSRRLCHPQHIQEEPEAFVGFRRQQFHVPEMCQIENRFTFHSSCSCCFLCSMSYIATETPAEATSSPRIPPASTKPMSVTWRNGLSLMRSPSASTASRAVHMEEHDTIPEGMRCESPVFAGSPLPRLAAGALLH